MGATSLSVLPDRQVFFPETVFRAGAATDTPLKVQGATGQTSNLAEFQSNIGTVLANITAGGNLELYNTNASIETGNRLSANTPYIDFHSSGNNNDRDSRILAFGGDTGHSGGMLQLSGAGLEILGERAASTPLMVRGTSGQTANIQEWRDSSGSVLASIYGDGRTYVGGSVAVIGTGAQLRVDSPVAGRVGLQVKGAAGQTANLAEFQDSSGTLLARIGSEGHLFSPIVVAGRESVTLDGEQVFRLGTNRAWDVYQRGTGSGAVTSWWNASTKVMRWERPDFSVLLDIDQNLTSASVRIRGGAGQTGNLAEFQNSAGTVYGGFSAAGQLIFNTVNSTATATAGTNGAPPAQVSGYMTVKDQSGNTRKIPYYNS